MAKTEYRTLLRKIDNTLVSTNDIELYALYTVISVLTTSMYSIPEYPEFGTRYWLLKHKLSTSDKVTANSIQTLIAEDLKRSIPETLLDLVNVNVTNVTSDNQNLMIEITVSLKSGRRSIKLEL